MPMSPLPPVGLKGCGTFPAECAVSGRSSDEASPGAVPFGQLLRQLRKQARLTQESSPRLWVPIISSAQVGVLSGSGRRPVELDTLRRSGRCDMMIGRAAPTGLPRRDERVRTTAAPSNERRGQRRRDPGAAPPGHRPGTATGQRPAAVLPADQTFLAALLQRVPKDVLSRFRLLMRPDTVLRWHRNLLAHRHAARSGLGARADRARPFHPPARAAPGPGEPVLRYQRIHGELRVLGIKTAASTVWEILHYAGILKFGPGRVDGPIFIAGAGG
jgi:hypothetical protein